MIDGTSSESLTDINALLAERLRTDYEGVTLRQIHSGMPVQSDENTIRAFAIAKATKLVKEAHTNTDSGLPGEELEQAFMQRELLDGTMEGAA